MSADERPGPGDATRLGDVKAPGEPTLVIGLTGPIGCGKSTVAAWLGELGATVVDADLVAREVVEPGEPALAVEYGDRALALGRDDVPMADRLVYARARLQTGRAADALADAELALAGRAAGEGSCLCHGGQILSGPGEVKGRLDGGRGRDRGGRRRRADGADAGPRRRGGAEGARSAARRACPPGVPGGACR